CVGDWVVRELAGLRPGNAGFEHFHVRPPTDSPLSWCKTSHESAHGLITVEWSSGSLELSVPVNATATISWRGEVLDVGSGRHSFRRF
ncbi:MAG TPA: alpha-L-rhamnosidase C-terminal domain-containing protein, partial [Roseateles sp.]|uniref:alpha-L-rhamnosidase C-terminal domain-containing protein n=1 Tax=Roseateles sp. TaxID=1971397 RepID=UPI002ED7E884